MSKDLVGTLPLTKFIGINKKTVKGVMLGVLHQFDASWCEYDVSDGCIASKWVWYILYVLKFCFNTLDR